MSDSIENKKVGKKEALKEEEEEEEQENENEIKVDTNKICSFSPPSYQQCFGFVFIILKKYIFFGVVLDIMKVNTEVKSVQIAPVRCVDNTGKVVNVCY